MLVEYYVRVLCLSQTHTYMHNGKHALTNESIKYKETQQAEMMITDVNKSRLTDFISMGC